MKSTPILSFGVFILLTAGCQTDPTESWQRYAKNVQAKTLPTEAGNIQTTPMKREGQALRITWSFTTAMPEDAYLTFLNKQFHNEFKLTRVNRGREYILSRYKAGTLDTMSVQVIGDPPDHRIEISLTSRPD